MSTSSNGFPKSVVIKSAPNWLHLGRQQAYRPAGQQKSAFQIFDGLLSYLSGLSRQRLIPSWNGLRLKSNTLYWSSCGASSAMPSLNNTLLFDQEPSVFISTSFQRGPQPHMKLIYLQRNNLIILCHSLPFQQPLYGSRDTISSYQELHSYFYLSSQSWSRSLVSSFNAHSSFGPRWAARLAILRSCLPDSARVRQNSIIGRDLLSAGNCPKDWKNKFPQDVLLLSRSSYIWFIPCSGNAFSISQVKCDLSYYESLWANPTFSRF